MPTYTYRCNNCKVKKEVIQSMNDDKLTKCDNCKQETLKRVIVDAGGFRIGGGGVYKPTSCPREDLYVD